MMNLMETLPVGSLRTYFMAFDQSRRFCWELTALAEKSFNLVVEAISDPLLPPCLLVSKLDPYGDSQTWQS